MFLQLFKISIRGFSLRRRGISSLGLRYLVLALWLAIPIPALRATPLELMGNDRTVSEERARPEGIPGIHALLPHPQELSELGGLSALRHIAHRTRPGETLTKLFIRFGLAEQERQLWLRSIQKHHPIKGLRAGQEMHLYFTKTESSPQRAKGKESLKALEIDLNEDWTLTWEKGSKGIIFSKREKPYDVEIKTVGGVVESSFPEEAVRDGLNQALIYQLADVFSWEVDFEKDIQKGDTFKLLYEQRSRKGRESKASFQILAAELINAGQKFFAIYFEKEKGKGGYYDLEGRSLARAFLRFPLEFTSISSQFSHSRFHPLLKVNLPHTGVDFAAERGTPVRAVGDGVVTLAGWNGNYGKAIDIQHD